MLKLQPENVNFRPWWFCYGCFMKRRFIQVILFTISVIIKRGKLTVPGSRSGGRIEIGRGDDMLGLLTLRERWLSKFLITIMASVTILISDLFNHRKCSVKVGLKCGRNHFVALHPTFLCQFSSGLSFPLLFTTTFQQRWVTRMNGFRPYYLSDISALSSSSVIWLPFIPEFSRFYIMVVLFFGMPSYSRLCSISILSFSGSLCLKRLRIIRHEPFGFSPLPPVGFPSALSVLSEGGNFSQPPLSQHHNAFNPL